MDAARKPVLVLHIGLPKTGSTALQNALAINREALAARGVYYAPVGVAPGKGPQRIFSGNGGALDRFLNPDRRERDYDPASFSLSGYVSPDHPVSLISSEWLSAARRHPLSAFKAAVEDAYEVRIVAYVRDLAAHARSAWVQALKTDAYHGDLSDYCAEKYTFNYQYRRLRLFRKIFGPAALTVIHYDSLRDGVLPALMRAIGVSADGLAPPVRANRGLTKGEVGLMRRLNALHRSPTVSWATSKLLTTLRPHQRPWNETPQAVVDLLEARHAEELRWTNDRCFGKRNVWRVTGGGDG